MKPRTQPPRQRVLFPERVGRTCASASGPDNEFDDAELLSLVAGLVRAIESRPSSPDGWLGAGRNRPHVRWEFTFEQVVQVCVAERCFPWLTAGGKWEIDEAGAPRLELRQYGKSALGKLLVKAAGADLRLDDGRIAVLEYRGRNRHRRYRVSVRS